MFTTLIVEDNVLFRQTLKGILCTRFPCMEVEETGDGKDALRRVTLSPPNLILMDIRLPGENGLELTKKIKADHPELVIVILTSYDLVEYRQAAQQYGADYFIAKGSSTGEEILTVIQSILLDMGIDFDSSKRREQ